MKPLFVSIIIIILNDFLQILYYTVDTFYRTVTYAESAIQILHFKVGILKQIVN